MTVRGKVLGIAGVAAALLASVSVADSRGFRRYLTLRQEMRNLELRNVDVARENDGLKREIAALRSDPAAQERAVREELSFVKPGEIVIHLEGH